MAIVFLLIIIPVFILYYKMPTCSDGKKNGAETGVDCGGACDLLCSFEGLNPIILWSRAFKVTNGVYSAVAYIQNPNINSETEVSYVFKLYDSNNALISTKANRTFIPKNKVLAIFEQNISVGEKVPVRATFEFTSEMAWRKNSAVQPELVITQKSLVGEETRPRVDAVIENKSIETVEQIEVVAVVYDSLGNAFAASRTFVDKLAKDESARISFTWLQPFKTDKVNCLAPVSNTSATNTLSVATSAVSTSSMSSTTSTSSASTSTPAASTSTSTLTSIPTTTPSTLFAGLPGIPCDSGSSVVEIIPRVIPKN